MEGTTGHSGGYRPSAGTAMPPLLPDRAEATAVALGTVVGRLTGMEETRWEPVAGKRCSGDQDAAGDNVVAHAQPSSPAPAPRGRRPYPKRRRTSAGPVAVWGLRGRCAALCCLVVAGGHP